MTFSVRPLVLALLMLTACASARPAPTPAAFEPIEGFSPKTNAALQGLFELSRKMPGRKVAVFDGDGTVLGQVPHYLADECLYLDAQKRNRQPEVVKHMTPLSNVSHPYVVDRVYYYEGETLEGLRAQGEACFKEHYANKVYPPMRALIAALHANDFEVWIVTASPEAMYQGFLSRELGIPVTRVVGVKSVVHDGKLTRRIVEPVPQDAGKKEAIETFVQERPLLVGGNSRGDKEMIEFSRGLKLIINPDEHVAPDQSESVAAYAEREGWLIERIRDVAEPGSSTVSNTVFGVRPNKSNPGPTQGQ